MIPRREFLEKARIWGVPVSTIERDYTQGWLLKNLSSIKMALLKGGTGIRKVFIKGYRFSDDLDFTMLSPQKFQDINSQVLTIVRISGEESGISFSEEIESLENENGYEINVYFQIMQRGPSRTKIKIDITRYEKEVIMLPIKERNIIHLYSDALTWKVKTYSLEEIFSEKIRSLFQGTRPRDLYDVWSLFREIDLKIVKEIVPIKFKVKGVKFELDELTSRRASFEKAWENSLRHQLKDLPDFNEVFDDVFELLMKEFWGIF